MGKAHQQRAVLGLDRFKCSHRARPQPRTRVGPAVARGDPTEEYPPPMPGNGFRRIESAPIEGIMSRRHPRAFRASRHPVPGDEAVGELRVHQVPPVTDPEKLGALLSDEAVRIPQRGDRGPVREVIADQPRHDPSAPVGTRRMPRRENEGPTSVPWSAVHLRVPPVGRVVPARGPEGVLRVLDPPFHIYAGGVCDELERPAIGGQPIRVARGVEEVEHPIIALTDTSGIGIEVLGINASGRECLTAVLIVDEVIRHHQRPGRSRLG